MNFAAGQVGLPIDMPLSMPMPLMKHFGDEVSTGDDSEGGSYPPANPNATRRSSSPDDFGDFSPESAAPEPWRVPLPGKSNAREFIPTQQDFNLDLLRAMRDMQSPQNHHNRQTGFGGPQDMTPGSAGYFSTDLAQQWLKKEVTELACLMAQRESEMQTLHQQLALLSTVQAPFPQSDVNQGMEMQIHLLQNQLDEISRMMRQTPAAKEQPQEEILTVMMRNIPNKYTQKMLIEEVNSVGFQGTWDFLYLPIDRESGANKGYAFINFLRPDYAYTFKRAFNGKQMALFKSNKIVNVTPAAIQGFEANHEHFSRTRVNFGDPDTRPLFLRKVQKVQKMPQPNTPSPMSGQEMSAQFTLPGSYPAASEAGLNFCTCCGARRSPVHKFCQGCGRTSS